MPSKPSGLIISKQGEIVGYYSRTGYLRHYIDVEWRQRHGYIPREVNRLGNRSTSSP